MSNRPYRALKWLINEVKYINVVNVIRTTIMVSVVGVLLLVIYQSVFSKVQCYYVVKDFERAGDWNPPFCINGMKWGMDEATHGCYASYDAAIQEVVKRQYKVCGK